MRTLLAFRAMAVVSLVWVCLCWSWLKAAEAESHWVGTWACGEQLTEPRNLPPVPLANSTLRQLVHVTLGGQRLRLRFSNAYGTEPVVMRAIHVALAAGAGSGGDGDINPPTDRALTFHSRPSVTIPPGAVVVSDSLNFNLPSLTNLAVTIYFGDISARTVTGHPGSRTTSFIVPGNAVDAASLPSATRTLHWYIVTGVDVRAEQQARALVTLGDSLTDGRGSTNDRNDRWPDVLGARLSTNTPTTGVAVLNLGIGGNGIFGGLGPSALSRFERDVLGQSGVRWVIVFEGVNDIGGDSRGTIATNLLTVYTQFITNAHAHHVMAYGATITPFGGSGYFSPRHEASRQIVNAWIRTNKLYDAVVDFDAAVRDPVTPTRLLPAYNSGDGLHLNALGYQAMANSIDLNLFKR